MRSLHFAQADSSLSPLSFLRNVDVLEVPQEVARELCAPTEALADQQSRVLQRTRVGR